MLQMAKHRDQAVTEQPPPQRQPPETLGAGPALAGGDTFPLEGVGRASVE